MPLNKIGSLLLRFITDVLTSASASGFYLVTLALITSVNCSKVDLPGAYVNSSSTAALLHQLVQSA